MTLTLALTSMLWGDLCAALEDDRETAGIIAARVVDGPQGTTLLGRRVTWAPQGAYLARRTDGLSLRSSGWVPAARAALAEGSIPIFIHTHPHGKAVFSSRDDDVDAILVSSLPGMGGGVHGREKVPVCGRVEVPAGGQLKVPIPRSSCRPGG